MGEQQPVAGEKPRTGLLRLDEQEFVERVFVGQGHKQRCGCGFGVEWKNLDPDPA